MFRRVHDPYLFRIPGAGCPMKMTGDNMDATSGEGCFRRRGLLPEETVPSGHMTNMEKEETPENTEYRSVIIMSLESQRTSEYDGTHPPALARF